MKIWKQQFCLLWRYQLSEALKWPRWERAQQIKKQVLPQFILETDTFELNFLVSSQTVCAVILGEIFFIEYGVAFDFKEKCLYYETRAIWRNTHLTDFRGHTLKWLIQDLLKTVSATLRWCALGTASIGYAQGGLLRSPRPTGQQWRWARSSWLCLCTLSKLIGKKKTSNADIFCSFLNDGIRKESLVLCC